MLDIERRRVSIRYASETVISTAQNREDVLLHRVLGARAGGGFYVDVGAGDPNWDSVTNWFYRSGWTGINIEANPMFAHIYAVHRQRDINLSMGIGGEPGSLTFHEVLPTPHQNGWGLSSFDPGVVARAATLGLECRQVSVEVGRLDSVLAQHADGRTIDFLKIDVEGFEANVIGSMDWHRFRPVVVCVESVLPNSAEPAFASWEPALLDAGYLFALFDGVNNYYLDKGREELLPQFNASVNANDRYRVAEVADFAVA